MTHPSPMVFALLLVQALLGTLCVVVSQGEERPLALRLWGWGLLAYSAALLIGLPANLSHGFNKVIANALIGFAAILTTSGLLQHSQVRLNRKWVGIAYAASVLLLVANHLQPQYSVALDLLGPSPFPNGLFIFAAVALFRNPPTAARSAVRFLAGILVVVVLLWTLRLSFILIALAGTNDLTRADMTISLFAVAQILVAVSTTLGLFWVEVRKMEAELKRLAGTDSLTGLPNRRALLQRFREEAARGVRHERPYSIVVFDIDHFKKLNDAHGHPYGDAVLKQVAQLLEVGKREVDVVGRFGGEEFVVVLSEEGAEGAALAAARLHARIERASAPGAPSSIPVTVSGGVATAPDDGLSWDELFAAADRRLYEAKTGGRNRVVSGRMVPLEVDAEGER